MLAAKRASATFFVFAEAGTSQEIEVVVPEGMGPGEPHPQT